MSVKLLYGQPQDVAEYVVARIPGYNAVSDFGDFAAVGFVNGDRLIGGAVFEHYTGFDVHIHLASDSPRWATKTVFYGISHLVFNQWRCRRCTALVGRKNKRARKFVEGFGFKYEGKKRLGLNGWEDLIIYGLLDTECKWIPQDASSIQRSADESSPGSTGKDSSSGQRVWG